MFVRCAAATVACLLISAAVAPAAWADPNQDATPAAATTGGDGAVPSGPPANLTTPDGGTLMLSSRDETALPVAPLTTAVSSRDYIVGGTFVGSLSGPGEARGTLEVGYDIGCGIDMSTSNGVTLAGTAGITPQLGVTAPFAGLPTSILPVVATPVGGAITVGLKPGIINIVPVDKKEFKGNDPWVMVSNFHIKIDGCVGQSFIRSYATLTRQTDESDVVLSWVGVTKAV
jgi:hypothetical protein